MFAHITKKLYLCSVKIKQQQLNDQGIMKNSRKKDLRIVREAIIQAKQDFLNRMEALSSEMSSIYDALEEQYDNLSERSQENEVGEKIQGDMSDVDYITECLADLASEDAEDSDLDVSEILRDIDNLLDY